MSFHERMRRLSLSIGVSAFILTLGCANRDPLARAKFDPETGSLGANLNFSENEIRSRRWQDPELGVVELLEFQLVHIENGHTLALAQFGSLNTRRSRWLEIYQHNKVPEYEQPSLRLLCRDSRKSDIAKVDFERQGDRHFVTVHRVFSTKEGKRMENMYSYEFNPKTGITATMSDFYWKKK
jgi:hypothetical protein